MLFFSEGIPGTNLFVALPANKANVNQSLTRFSPLAATRNPNPLAVGTPRIRVARRVKGVGMKPPLRTVEQVCAYKCLVPDFALLQLRQELTALSSVSAPPSAFGCSNRRAHQPFFTNC